MAEMNNLGRLITGVSFDKFSTTSSARFNLICERTTAKQQKVQHQLISKGNLTGGGITGRNPSSRHKHPK